MRGLGRSIWLPSMPGTCVLKRGPPTMTHLLNAVGGVLDLLPLVVEPIKGLLSNICRLIDNLPARDSPAIGTERGRCTWRRAPPAVAATRGGQTAGVL